MLLGKAVLSHARQSLGQLCPQRARLMRTGTSAERLCSSAQCERQLSLEVQEIPQRSLQKVLHPLRKPVSSDGRLQFLGPRAERAGFTVHFPPLCIGNIGLPPDPAGNTALFGMSTTVPLSLS